MPNLSTGSASTAAQLLYSTVEGQDGSATAVITKVEKNLETAEAKTALSRCLILRQAMTTGKVRLLLAVAFAEAII